MDGGRYYNYNEEEEQPEGWIARVYFARKNDAHIASFKQQGKLHTKRRRHAGAPSPHALNPATPIPAPHMTRQ